MLKKISMVLCAGLFATAFAAGCKKDEKKDGEVSAASCDSVAAKIAAQMQTGDPATATPEAKKATADFQVALAKLCSDDKWPEDALKCVTTAKDPKTECKGKLKPEQDSKISELVKTMMSAGVTGQLAKDEALAGADTAGVVGAGSGTGMGSGTGAVAPTPEEGAMAGAGKFPATCEGVGARAAADITTDMPPGMPADLGAKVAAKIVNRCTTDKWSADVISCGVTAADPETECSPKLTPEQNAAMDKDMETLQKEMMEALAAAANAGGGGGGGDGSTGIKECDEFMAAVAKLAQCDKLDPQMKKGFQDMAGSLEILKSLPDSQKGEMAEQCKQGMAGVAETAKTAGC